VCLIINPVPANLATPAIQGYYFKMFKILIIILILFSTNITVFGAQEKECKVYREISGANYWYWDAYLGVVNIVDTKDVRTGRLNNKHDNSCFTTSLIEINDQLNRLIGYKTAVSELFKLHGGTVEVLKLYKWEKRGEKYITALEQKIFNIESKITSLLGADITIDDQGEKWWHENQDYMYLSEDKQKLLLDSVAKKQKKPIHETNPEREISAEDFWIYSVSPAYEQTKITDKYIHGRVMTEHSPYKFRVQKFKLNDRKTKENVYKTILENEIMYFKNARESKQHSYLKYATARLKNVTGLDYTDSQTWINWWEKNKDKLVLSKDGTVLVVGNYHQR
jgi:hypothetical protein